ncbi:hypothetical protein AV530_019612 [Patagioenas fasciata monilis]|uniref:Uncharacterized protein n=1 Tax=Patagioenas fasciata monilis TaxID=372326 RepID=A0A1V4JDZ2_PATFA|nr:hypothetical protein AV530_019612 [Patagioenas fasciata monilis]
MFVYSNHVHLGKEILYPPEAMLGCYWNYSSHMSGVSEKRSSQICVIQIAIAAKELSLQKQVLSIPIIWTVS